MNADMFVVRHAQSRRAAPDRRAPERDGPRARARRQRRRRPPRAPDAGPARPVHDPPLQEGLPRAHGGDRRRRPALARRALADPRADDARRARGARDRPARRCCRRAVEAMGVRVFHDMREGLAGCDVVMMLRLQNERMNGALLPSRGRVLQALRPHAGEARARQARRDRHASGTDEPRRRDRFGGGRRRALGDPAAGDVRHRGADGGDEHPRGQSVDADEDRDRNGRVVDPAAWHRSRRVALRRCRQGSWAIGEAPADWRADRTIDATGLRRLPGLVDLSARLREPGFEYKATLESEMRAAVAGGVTSLACPPDTDPPLDEPGLVEMLKHRARTLNQAHVYPVGALTVGLQGETLTEMGELAEAGCVAFSQADVAARRHAGAAARACSTRRPSAIASGCVRRMRISRAAASRTTARSRRGWGLPAIPVSAETIALATILALVRETGVPRAPVPALVGRGRGDGPRGEGRRAAGHLRRRGPSPAPARHRHRLVRSASRTWRRRCAARAIAKRCAPALADGTIDVDLLRPHAGRRRRQAGCRSPKPSRARPGSNCCCR